MNTEHELHLDSDLDWTWTWLDLDFGFCLDLDFGIGFLFGLGLRDTNFGISRDTVFGFDRDTLFRDSRIRDSVDSDDLTILFSVRLFYLLLAPTTASIDIHLLFRGRM